MNPIPNSPLRSITCLDDDLLPAWLDLYETAFPAEERLLVSVFLKLLKNRQAESAPWEMLAMTDVDRSLLGIVFYETLGDLKTAALWYLAVDPERRSQGLGAQIYRDVRQRVSAAGCVALIFEVEIPELCLTPVGQALAQRRIRFYQRQGALLLSGIEYWQSVGPHQPKTRMHLMIDPLGAALEADQAFRLCKSIYGPALSQSGSLAWQSLEI